MMKRILILTTRNKWYNYMKKNGNSFHTTTCDNITDFINNLGFDMKRNGSSFWNNEDYSDSEISLLKCQPNDNDYLYVIPCIFKDLYQDNAVCAELKTRQRFITALIKDVKKDLNELFSDSALDIKLWVVAHDMDLFETTRERSFNTAKDFIEKSFADEINSLKTKVYGYQHSGEPVNLTVFPIIRDTLAVFDTVPKDIIDLFLRKITNRDNAS